MAPVAGRNIHTTIEIASISKVMTCYLTLLCCRKYNIDVYSYQARVTDKAADMPGTTAELQSGDEIADSVCQDARQEIANTVLDMIKKGEISPPDADRDDDAEVG